MALASACIFRWHHDGLHLRKQADGERCRVHDQPCLGALSAQRDNIVGSGAIKLRSRASAGGRLPGLACHMGAQGMIRPYHLCNLQQHNCMI